MYLTKKRFRTMKSVLAEVVGEFRKRGIDSVLIGSFSIPVLYNVLWDGDDIDLFITNKSPMFDLELFEEIALEKGWTVGTNPYGLPYFEVDVKEEVVRVELFENVFDIYIPEKLIENTARVNIDGNELKVIKAEQLIVLKARAASEEDIEFLKRMKNELIDKGKLKINFSEIEKALEAFPEDERNSIRRRIAKIGFYKGFELQEEL